VEKGDRKEPQKRKKNASKHVYYPQLHDELVS